MRDKNQPESAIRSALRSWLGWPAGPPGTAEPKLRQALDHRAGKWPDTSSVLPRRVIPMPADTDAVRCDLVVEPSCCASRQTSDYAAPTGMAGPS